MSEFLYVCIFLWLSSFLRENLKKEVIIDDIKEMVVQGNQKEPEKK